MSSLIGNEAELYHLIYGKKVPTPENPGLAIKEADLIEFIKYVMPSRLKESSVDKFPRRVPFLELDPYSEELSPTARPPSAAFFTCRAGFQDSYGKLDMLLEELDVAQQRMEAASTMVATATNANDSAKPPVWLPRSDLEGRIGHALYDAEYADLLQMFNKLWAHPLGGQRAQEALAPFLLSSLGKEHKPPRGTVDADGHGHGTGHRKTSTAQVVVSPGSGTFTVNGHSLATYFTSPVARFHAYEPLRLTDTLQRVDVAATVQGGGPSGKAGAVRHGLSLALGAMDAAYEKMLDDAGMLTRDLRIVERKKSGQKKARKKFQWVKR